jgi:thiol-disulfide isomerase/thioredoxin
MYHRIGCHLCEQMAASLYALQGELDYDVELIDIDEDEILKQRYDVDVPVVAYRDEVIFYHFFDEECLRTTFK